MANRKISELTAAGALDGSELVEVVQSGTNKKTTTQDIADLGGGGGGAVDSVNGQTGVVVLGASDIENIPNGNVSAVTVQAAINELDADITAGLAGLKWKSSVRVATTVAGTLASDFENGDSIDGVTLATGNRILIKNQADQTQNGIYTVNASGAPTRSTDADAAAELESAAVTVDEGTSNANTTWLQTTDSITLGVSNIVWTQFGSSVPDASETVKGILELSTQAETTTGTNDLTAVTPLKLHTKNRQETAETADRPLAQTDDQKVLFANKATTLTFDCPPLEENTYIVITQVNAGDVAFTTSGGVAFENAVTPAITGGAIGSGIVLWYRTTTSVLAMVGDITNLLTSLSINGALAIKAGSSSGIIAKVGGCIHTDTTSTGNSGTGEDVLFTHTLIGAILATNKDSIRGYVAGTFAANGNNKNIRVKFGGSTIFSTGAVAFNSGDWCIDFQIIRTGATSQKSISRFTSSNTTLDETCDYVTSSETLSGPITFVVSGEGTANNDIVGEMLKIFWESHE